MWTGGKRIPPPDSGKIAPTRKSTPPGKPAGKRFVEPHRLSAEQRDELSYALHENGIGDAESRRLFATAMEYDLAGCKVPAKQGRLSKPIPGRRVRTRSDDALADMASSAQILADRLANLTDALSARLQQGLSESDRFGRTYGNDYLASLHRGLTHLARAGARQATPDQDPDQSEPAVPEEMLVFIRRAAGTFHECFEQQPTVEHGSPFMVAIRAIADTTGIDIPTDRGTVARALEKDR